MTLYLLWKECFNIVPWQSDLAWSADKYISSLYAIGSWEILLCHTACHFISRQSTVTHYPPLFSCRQQFSLFSSLITPMNMDCTILMRLEFKNSHGNPSNFLQPCSLPDACWCTSRCLIHGDTSVSAGRNVLWFQLLVLFQELCSSCSQITA